MEDMALENCNSESPEYKLLVASKGLEEVERRIRFLQS